MLYEEFNQYESFVDPENPLCNAYLSKDRHVFYVEPGFYFMLKGFEEKRPDRYNEILEAIYRIIDENEKVVFCGNYETPFLIKKDFIYKEITDISDPLQIYVEDKSRGSDYGD